MRWGTSYYPELVDEAEWARDLDHMCAAGIDCLRILDFAWTAIEPREGCFTWEWLDRFVALAAERNLGLILCTPTATPPPWLARQFPEIMIENRDGTLRQLGARRDADVDSPIYRHFSALIAGALGRRYGQHPAVLGWQIDNEMLGPEGVSPECHSRASQWRFRDFLKRRHGDIATLNRRWGLRFWNQEYSDWGEVDTPRQAVRCVLGHWLDYQRFFSESQRDFINVQLAALRAEVLPTQWISTNATAVFDRGLDHLTFAESLDMVGWDAYVGAAAGNAACQRHAFTAAAHDLFRAAKAKPFWVFETNALDHEITAAFCAEAAARGAAGIIFWHWRPHRANMESGGVAICDLAGRPVAERIARLQALRAHPELTALKGPLARRRAAILFCNDNVRAEDCPKYSPGRPPVRYLEIFASMYAAMWRLGIAVDVVRPQDDLSGYQLIGVPSLLFVSQEVTAKLTSTVAAGTVLLGCAKSAHRDAWGACYDEPVGPLTDMLGFAQRWDEWVEGPLTIQFGNEVAGQVFCPGAAWAERADVTDGEVLARFTGGALDGSVAAFRRRHGTGHVFYLATTSDAAIELLARQAAITAGMTCVDHTHPNVGSCADLAGRGQWYFNHESHVVNVDGLSIPAGGYALKERLAHPLTMVVSLGGNHA